MTLRSLGWAFSALALGMLAGYLLNRGVYVGSTLDVRHEGAKTFYYQRCHYLYLNGIDDETTIFPSATPEEARFLCPLVRNSN
jgi:hypothetical protein